MRSVCSILIGGLTLAVAMIAGCGNEPKHQVAITAPDIDLPAPGPVKSGQSERPRLSAVRPLDEGKAPADKVAAPAKPREKTPKLSEVSAGSADESLVVYVVQAGDTYWKIAASKLGNGRRHNEIALANPGVNQNALKVGQKIRIPAK